MKAVMQWNGSTNIAAFKNIFMNTIDILLCSHLN